ncbi:MAG: 50S ribosomal protein L21 [Candidatus Peribacteria bacterium]|nr:MAG: 50S ribosomal protein L21 [Candidatus Peribacteria bacterium]
MHAVIAIKGHQQIVAEGDQIVVDLVEANEGDKVEFDTILCSFDDTGSTVHVGTPYVPGKVVAKVVGHQQGDKVKVFKFQSKKRYQRNR